MSCRRWASTWKPSAWKSRKQVGTGPDQKMIGNIPYTPRVKKVLALAAKEAEDAQSHLRRHGAHFARPAARRRRRGRAGAEESRRGHRADPPGNLEGTGPEFCRAEEPPVRRPAETAPETAAGEKRRSQNARAQGVWPRPDGNRPQRRHGSGHRPQERNRARHPDSLPPHEEQSRPARRSRRGQDRHRRRSGAGNRQGQCAGNFARTSASSRSTWR